MSDTPPETEEPMIPMRVGGVVVDPNTQVPVVILRGVEEPRLYVPIFIGGLEATAIATVLAGVKMPRPMTHDLMVSLLDAVLCKVTGVAIIKLEGGTFYAQVYIADESGGELVIDARPSDALALALRMEASIVVARSVIAEAGALAPEEEGPTRGELADIENPESDDLPDMPPEAKPPGTTTPDAAADRAKLVPDGPRSFFGDVKLEDLVPEDFGKYKM
jgi:hypothetical protein